MKDETNNNDNTKNIFAKKKDKEAGLGLEVPN